MSFFTQDSVRVPKKRGKLAARLVASQAAKCSTSPPPSLFLLLFVILPHRVAQADLELVSQVMPILASQGCRHHLTLGQHCFVLNKIVLCFKNVSPCTSQNSLQEHCSLSTERTLDIKLGLSGLLSTCAISSASFCFNYQRSHEIQA